MREKTELSLPELIGVNLPVAAMLSVAGAADIEHVNVYLGYAQQRLMSRHGIENPAEDIIVHFANKGDYGLINEPIMAESKAIALFDLLNTTIGQGYLDDSGLHETLRTYEELQKFIGVYRGLRSTIERLRYFKDLAEATQNVSSDADSTAVNLSRVRSYNTAIGFLSARELQPTARDRSLGNNVLRILKNLQSIEEPLGNADWAERAVS